MLNLDPDLIHDYVYEDEGDEEECRFDTLLHYWMRLQP